MSLDSPPVNADIAPTEAATDAASPEVDPNVQVRFKSQAGKVLLLLPPEPSATLSPWPEVWEQLKHRLRSEEHTSELQSQSTISYAVFCLKKKKKK